MIITVDWDNCLNNLTEKTIDLYNKTNGTEIQLSDITTYDFFECLPENEANGICKLFKEKKLWDSLSPLAGAREALKTLIKQGHTIYIATATDISNFEWKCKWLTKFYPFISTDNVIRIMDKSLIKTDVLIEDKLENLIGNFAERICIDYPWNRSTSKDYAYGIHRVSNWSEIPQVIKEIEGEMAKW